MDDPSYRLLYRGALSLPDSLLLLDGLTFAVRLNSPSKPSAFNLLENPLALALESMRGRPSLRFLGTVFLRDVWMDESGGVEMYVNCRSPIAGWCLKKTKLQGYSSSRDFDACIF